MLQKISPSKPALGIRWSNTDGREKDCFDFTVWRIVKCPGLHSPTGHRLRTRVPGAHIFLDEKDATWQRGHLAMADLVCPPFVWTLETASR